MYQYPNLSVKIPLRYFSLPAFSMSSNRHQAASFRQKGQVHSLTFFSANPLAKVMPSITQNFSETRDWFALGGVDHPKLCVKEKFDLPSVRPLLQNLTSTLQNCGEALIFQWGWPAQCTGRCLCSLLSWLLTFKCHEAWFLSRGKEERRAKKRGAKR